MSAPPAFGGSITAAGAIILVVSAGSASGGAEDGLGAGWADSDAAPVGSGWGAAEVAAAMTAAPCGNIASYRSPGCAARAATYGGGSRLGLPEDGSWLPLLGWLAPGLAGSVSASIGGKPSTCTQLDDNESRCRLGVWWGPEQCTTCKASRGHP